MLIVILGLMPLSVAALLASASGPRHYLFRSPGAPVDTKAKTTNTPVKVAKKACDREHLAQDRLNDSISDFCPSRTPARSWRKRPGLKFVSGRLDESFCLLTPLGQNLRPLIQSFRAKGLLLTVDFQAGSI